MKIFIANLKAYNEGRLVGEWIDLNVLDDIDEVMEEIEKICPDGEEYSIHDTEGFPFDVSENESLSNLHEWARILYDSDESFEVLKAIFDEMNGVHSAIDIIENVNFRKWYDCGDMEDVARAFLEETGGLEGLPEHLERYFNYAEYGEDMEKEGTFIEVSSENMYIEITD